MILGNFTGTETEKLRAQGLDFIHAGDYAQAVKAFGLALKESGLDPLLHNQMGQALMLDKQRDEAYAVFRKAFALDPNNHNTLNNLGLLCLEREEWPQAQTYLERSLRVKPDDNFEALVTLGKLYGKREQFVQAETVFKAALKLRPDDREVHRNMAVTYVWRDNTDAALKEYKWLLEREPENIAFLHAYAMLAGKNRDRNAVLKTYENILALDSADEKAWLGLISHYEQGRLITRAKEALSRAEKYCKGPAIALSRARVMQHEDQADIAQIAFELEQAATGLESAKPENAALFFELGRLYDRINDADKAFGYFEKANNCQNNDPAHAYIDRDFYRLEVTRFKDIVQTRMPARWSDSVPYEESPEPVFLVGFPRSGTTLLDQIMHSHPDIEVAEEYPATNAALSVLADARKKSYPESLAYLDESEIQALRKSFFETHRQKGANFSRKILVDKLPLNIAHAALIYRMFPDAKFIMALRHPCDCVLSCYMQAFQINAAMINFLDLRQAARFYDSLFSLWEIYEEFLPFSVHRVKYEDVVADFKPTIAGLLNYLDVPWDDAVLEYDRTAKERGFISTPSYNQVTQKIYTRASGRWEAYREYLTPVLDMLLPWAEKHGYKG